MRKMKRGKNLEIKKNIKNPKIEQKKFRVALKTKIKMARARNMTLTTTAKLLNLDLL